MEKYTVIYLQSWTYGDKKISITRMSRVKGTYGQILDHFKDIQFTFEDWPKLREDWKETGDIVDLSIVDFEEKAV